jgi:glycosyltransferase involved in cell wall biosynthesis
VTRILIVTEAGDALPSGVVRGSVYREQFARHGLSVTFVPRQPPALMRLAVSPRRSVATLMRTGALRPAFVLSDAMARVNDRRIVTMAGEYDVVYLLKIGSYALVEQLRAATKARLVFDLNDSLWLRPNAGFADGRLDDILRGVDAVVSDNEYGMAYARKHNSSVYMVPEHPQVELFDAQRGTVRKRTDEVVLGWIGGPSTAFNLFSIWEPLERLFKAHDRIRLHLVGVGHFLTNIPRFEQVRFTTVPAYTQATMIPEVLSMDIGLYPLFDVEDSYARGIMKATIYMSAGLATICSAIGANTRLIDDGVNGMLARTPDEWFTKLEQLILDRDLRAHLGQGGLETIRSNYTIEHSFARLRTALLGE